MISSSLSAKKKFDFETNVAGTSSKIGVHAFFDPDTYTLTYLVIASETKEAVVIDPVLDFDPASGQIRLKSVKALSEFCKKNDLMVCGVLETHAHADHMSGAQEIKRLFPKAQIGIGRNIVAVQSTFKEVFDLEKMKCDGSDFDFLIQDQEKLRFGALQCVAHATPGHTPACMSFQFENFVFTGDAIFYPDSGTGRCDFPGGDARELYRSIATKLYRLEDAENREILFFAGHDYQPNQRPVHFASKMTDQKKSNIHLSDATTESDYVAFRTQRDGTLSAPRLLLPSLQVNLRAGKLPESDAKGKQFLKVPIQVEL